MGTPTVKLGFENGPTFAALSAACTQPLLPCAAAQPLTLTLVTLPFELNVTLARDTSSAPATQAFAPPITGPNAAATAPCDGCSGMFWLPFPALAGAGSGLAG